MRRFSPISAEEVPALECSVTLLSDFEEAADYADWQVASAPRCGARAAAPAGLGRSRTDARRAVGIGMPGLRP